MGGKGILGLLLIVGGGFGAYFVLSGKLAALSSNSGIAPAAPDIASTAVQGVLNSRDTSGEAGSAGAVSTGVQGSGGNSGAPGDIRPYMYLAAPTLSPISGVPISQWKGLLN